MSMRTAKSGTNAQVTYGFNEDADTGLHSPSDNVVTVVAGGTEIARFGSRNGPTQYVRIPITSASDQSGVLTNGSLANPFGKTVLITQAIFYYTTASGAACTLDIGVAANATTSADNLLDGINVNATAPAVYDSENATDRGTNGMVRTRTWGATQFINVAEAGVSNSSGLVGELFVEVIVP